MSDLSGCTTDRIAELGSDMVCDISRYKEIRDFALQYNFYITRIADFEMLKVEKGFAWNN